MSLLNCDHCGARAPGRLRGVYVALGQLGTFDRYKLRLCSLHFASVENHLSEYEVMPVDEATRPLGPSSKCLSGGEPLIDTGWQFFVTAYPADDQRKDYWGYICYSHETPAYLKPIRS